MKKTFFVLKSLPGDKYICDLLNYILIIDLNYELNFTIFKSFFLQVQLNDDSLKNVTPKGEHEYNEPDLGQYDFYH